MAARRTFYRFCCASFLVFGCNIYDNALSGPDGGARPISSTAAGSGGESTAVSGAGGGSSVSTTTGASTGEMGSGGVVTTVGSGAGGAATAGSGGANVAGAPGVDVGGRGGAGGAGGQGGAGTPGRADAGTGSEGGSDTTGRGGAGTAGRGGANSGETSSGGAGPSGSGGKGTAGGGGSSAGASVQPEAGAVDATSSDVSVRADASSPPGAVFSVGSFVKTAAAGPQIVAHALGQTPKALLLFTSGKTSAAESGDYLFAMGATSAPGSSMSASMASDDNVSPTSSSRRMAPKALSIVQWGQLTIAEADLTAWDSTNVTLNWTTNNDVAYVIHYVAIGGAAVSAKVVPWQAPIAPGMKSITGVGFRPDLVFHFHVGWFFTATPPASDTNAGFGIGAMDHAGGQWAIHFRASDAKNPSLTGKTERTDSAIYVSNEVGPTVTKQASFVSMDSDGFTLNFTTSNSSASQLFSLALSGMQANVGSFAKVTGAAPAAQPVTSPGFQPGLLFLSSAQSIADTGISTDHARLGIGASDGTNALCSAISDTNGLTTSAANAQDATGSAFVKVNNPTGNVDARADLASFDPTGFTLNWSVNDSVATQICYVALGSR